MGAREKKRAKHLVKENNHGRCDTMADVDEKLRQILDVLDQLAEDTSVPRNIRRGAAEAKNILLKKDEDLDVRAASAISILDELANDPNIPLHGRTIIWNIISRLEALSAGTA